MKTKEKSMKANAVESPDSDSSVYSDLSDESMSDSDDSENETKSSSSEEETKRKSLVNVKNKIESLKVRKKKVKSKLHLPGENIQERALEEKLEKECESSSSEETQLKNLVNGKNKIGHLKVKNKTERKGKQKSKLHASEESNQISSSENMKHDFDAEISNKTQNLQTTFPSIPTNEDEYAHDTSDEEDIRNTVGNIPMKWYDDLPHIGYAVDGNKIMKPATTDEIDEFLSKMDDPNYWRTVKNKMTGEKVVLTDEDLDIIQRIQAGKYPTSEVKYEPFEDFFTYETMKHPVTHFPPHKRSFIPSVIDKQKVSKLVHAIKMGWIKPRIPKEDEDQFYMLWDKDVAEESKRLRNYIPAPKRKLPGHEESYNPPPEFLFNKEEEEKWKEQEPEERKLDFIPRKYSILRQVPAYSSFIKEAFERCLDLYLCPRQRKMRVNVDPNELLPPLPRSKDLQPFPSNLAIIYTGHSELVRCVTVEPNGQFVASGSDDQTVKIWEVLTGRCLRTINVGGVVKSLAWCPNEALSLFLVAVEEKVYAVNTLVGDKVVISNTDSVLHSLPENQEEKNVSWNLSSEEQKQQGFRLFISHTHPVKTVVWHAKGDYFATLTTDESFKSIIIHQLSKFRSQIPFKKLDGKIQCILFHPLRPFFFVASQKHIKMYNLIKQEMSKKLLVNSKLISSMAIHPQGDNIIVGSYDCKVNWFDIELSTKPYKTFRHHKKAVRQVVYHKRYPLFASTSDDGYVIISHGMVYSDLLQNPTIHFVKALKGHEMSLDCCFHPQRPWIFSTSGHTIRLYS